MANLITDPGYELDDALWQFVPGTVGDGTERRANSARAGSWGARIAMWATEYISPPLGPIVAQVVTLPDLDDRILRFWIRQTLTPNSIPERFKFRIWIFPGEIDPVTDWPSEPPGQDYFAEWTADGEIGEYWEQQESGVFTPTDTTLTIIADATFSYPGGGSVPLNPARWDLDSWSLLKDGEVDVAQGMYDGWSALKTGLQSINGAAGGYWNDLTSAKVFDTLVIPGERNDMPAVYLCVPFTEETERYEELEQHGVRCYWTQTIYAFVQDTKDDPLATDTVELVSKVRDDLIRYFQKNPRLSGVTVKNIIPISGMRVAGAVAEDDYGELQLTVEVQQLVGWADLGPDA